MNANMIHFLVCLLIVGSIVTCLATGSTKTTVNVGVVLDLDSWVGRVGLNCIKMALTDFYASHSFYKTRIVLNTRNSNGDITAAAIAGLDLVKNLEVQAIITGTTSTEAYLLTDLGDKAKVPIVTFTTTSSILREVRNPYFFRVAQAKKAQVKPICDLVKAFEWTEAVPIFEDGQYREPIHSLIGALQEINVRVPYFSLIPSSATNAQIRDELYKLKTMQTRVFIVQMTLDLGSQFFTIAEQSGMMSEGYVWIMTESLTSLLSLMSSTTMNKMSGTIGVRTYIPRSKEYEDFEVRWRKQIQTNDPLIIGGGLSSYGLWAYDATTALAMAFEKVGAENWGFRKTNTTGNMSTDIVDLGVSENGEKLSDALSNTTFRGVSGEFHLLNGGLEASTFEIINVNGNGEIRIGFWRAQGGLMRDLKSTKTIETRNSSHKSSLRPVIWPGDSTSTPRGWEIRRLKIAVPLVRFQEFQKTRRGPRTDGTRFFGYSLDIFAEVVTSMPYPVSYELVHFGGYTYDDLITQVHDQKFDAAVGDITITANRSLLVDFTLPFTDNGAAFVVPTKDKNKSNTWIFLQPLTWKLWLTTGCFFVYIGFVVWALEHRINEDFRGSPSNQIGTSFWFSFSTLVFAQRERVLSNTARLVIIIWVFVVLILTESYAASLSSFLTVQQLRPTVTDVDELLNNGASVGYQRRSLTYGILRQLGFSESRLIPYDSSQMFDHLMTLGTRNGGIDAAFDEMSYIQLLQSAYCSKYTIIQTGFRTNGLGFAFRKYLPLTPDISRAILNLTQQNTKRLEEIQNRWFRNDRPCQETPTGDSSYRLDLDNFWGLFLIAGITSLLALIIHIAVFLYGQRQILTQYDPKDSVWTKIRVMLRIFKQKDLKEKTPEDSKKAPEVVITLAPSPTFHPSGSLERSHSSLF